MRRHRIQTTLVVIGTVLLLIKLLSQLYTYQESARHKRTTQPRGPRAMVGAMSSSGILNKLLAAPETETQPDLNIIDCPHSPSELHMTIFCTASRFGNHLFMYASSYGIAKSTHRKLTLDPLFYDIKDMFPDISEDLVENPTTMSVAYEDGFYGTYMLQRFSLGQYCDVQIYGYLQSYRYFDHCKADITRNLRSITDRYLNGPRMFLQETRQKVADASGGGILPSDVVFVGIHYRLGDVKNNDEYRTPRDFFLRAMSYFKNRYNTVHFITTSDSKNVMDERLKLNSIESTMSPFLNYQEDFALMTLCDHIIWTTGTFGWWIAYLSGGDVIYYDYLRDKQLKHPLGFTSDDFYPNHWMPLT